MSGGKLTFDPGSGDMLHTLGARTIWSNRLAPALILPALNTIVAECQITFPDFKKGNAMWMGFSSYAFPIGDVSEAHSWSIIRAGEWGPDAAGAFNLPRQWLGFVPEAANNLEVSINLANTVVPSPFDYSPVIKLIEENATIDLDGGCTALEGRAGWRRGIKIVKIGGSVYLERYQSVGYRPLAMGYKSGAQVWTDGPFAPWANQYTHDGDPSGWRAYYLGGTGQGGNINKARGSSNAPPTYDPSNFSSTWAGTIVVRPTVVRT